MTAEEQLPESFSSAVVALSEAGAKGADGFAVAKLPICSTGLSVIGACKSGDELLRLPAHLCLSGQLESTPPAMRPALEFVAAADENSAGALHRRLCVRLWLERLQPSEPFFAAWLPAMESAALSRSEASALRWKAETGELARCGALCCVPHHAEKAREEAEALRAVLEDVAGRFPDVCPTAPDESQAEWLHLTCLAHSLLVRDRMASGPEAEKAPTRYLVPLLDVAHTAGSAATGAVAEMVTGTVIVSAVRPLQAGDQVLCTRGAASNDELAVTSGAVVAENVNQQVVLSLAFGSLRQEQLTVLRSLGLDSFLRADEDGRAILSIVLRRSDPFPNVAIVLARVLTGSEDSPDLQKPVSSETSGIDRRWLPTLLGALKAQLQQYPMRDAGKPAADAADVIYDSSREVLKASVAHLLELTKQMTAQSDAVQSPAAAA